jgi:hypothetical protein
MKRLVIFALLMLVLPAVSTFAQVEEITVIHNNGASAYAVFNDFEGDCQAAAFVHGFEGKTVISGQGGTTTEDMLGIGLWAQCNGEYLVDLIYGYIPIGRRDFRTVRNAQTMRAWLDTVATYTDLVTGVPHTVEIHLRYLGTDVTGGPATFTYEDPDIGLLQVANVNTYSTYNVQVTGTIAVDGVMVFTGEDVVQVANFAGGTGTTRVVYRTPQG